MAQRVGTDRATGRLLTDWAHCTQSIQFILATRLGSVIMLLNFGSDVPSLIDKPGTAETIARCYAAIADALRRWEPGFRVREFELIRAGSDGVFEIELRGVFYPRGHLGDYSLSEPRSMLGQIRGVAS